MRLNPMDNRRTATGVAFAFGGMVTILFSLLREASAFTMSPGVEGSLTACVVGVALALSEGVAFTSVAAAALPFFLLQYVGCRYAGEPSLGMIGLEAVVIGLVGLLVPARSPARKGSSALVRVHVSA